MNFCRFSAAVMGASLLAAPLCAEPGWSTLRAGMSRDEISDAVGVPLMKSSGRGFELWLYDHGAEIVCYRKVLVAWTAPARTPADVASVAPAPSAAAKPAAPVRRDAPVATRRPSDAFPDSRTEMRM